MYFRIIIFLALVATISLGINWVVVNDGSIEFIWLGYKVQTSVAFFIFAFTFIVILLIIIFQILITIFTIPRRVGKKYNDYLLENNLKNLQIGYAALLSGDVEQAKKASQKLLDKPSKNRSVGNLTDMLIAKVAQEEGNLTLAQDYFNKFLGNKKQRFFAVKSMLDTAFQQGKIDEAMDYAEQAYELRPNVKDGARSLLELYKKAGQFAKAEEFLKKYKRKHLLFKDRYNDIDVGKELGIINLERAKHVYDNEKGVSIKDKTDLHEARKLAEKAIRNDIYNKENINLLLSIYKQLKQESKARSLIEKVWPRLQSLDLGLAYLDVYTAANYKDSAKKKLKAIERLKNLTKNDEIIEKLKDKIYQF